MTYAEFLLRAYNLPFLVAAMAGLAVGPLARRAGRDALGPAVGLLAAGVCGLTLNGALHDFALGSPAPRFPLVAVVSAAVGVLAAAGATRFRARHFPPISDVQLTGPGWEGSEGVVVSRRVGPEPGSGRVQWQGTDGVLHLVRAHTASGELAFGHWVRLGPYDGGGRSYLLESLR